MNITSNWRKFLRNFNLNIFHDIQSTSFAFSMALNIPSLLINPFHLSYYTVDLQKKIAELQEAKILHRNFKSALVFLNKIYKEPNIWWKLKKTQKARSMFCRDFANISRANIIENLSLIFFKEKKKLERS